MTDLITEPGVYDGIPDRDYHRDPVAGGSLSSTGARTLAVRTPAHFLHQRTHGRGDTAAFDVGHVAHAMVLGVGGELVEVDAKDWRTNKAKDERAAAREAGNTPLLIHQADEVRLLVDAIRSDPVAGPLFARPGRAEQTVVARDPETDVMVRARPDWLPDVEPGERLIVVDLKTTEDASDRGFAKSCSTYGYVQQDPFYCDALHWTGLTIAGEHGELVEPLFVFVVVEKTPPHLVAVHRLLPEDRARGRELNRLALDRYREGRDTGRWPGHTGSLRDGLPMPGWWRAQHDAASDAGRYLTTADRADELGVVDDPDLELEDTPA